MPGHRTRTGPRLAVAAIPIVIVLGLFFGRTRTVAPNGDEPHYLIIADSVASDRDLNLQTTTCAIFRKATHLPLPAPR
jgi:hypothetical protein